MSNYDVIVLVVSLLVGLAVFWVVGLLIDHMEE
jgi:hypothetical protein